MTPLFPSTALPGLCQSATSCSSKGAKSSISLSGPKTQTNWRAPNSFKLAETPPRVKVKKFSSSRRFTSNSSSCLTNSTTTPFNSLTRHLLNKATKLSLIMAINSRNQLKSLKCPKDAWDPLSCLLRRMEKSNSSSLVDLNKDTTSTILLRKTNGAISLKFLKVTTLPRPFVAITKMKPFSLSWLTLNLTSSLPI